MNAIRQRGIRLARRGTVSALLAVAAVGAMLFSAAPAQAATIWPPFASYTWTSDGLSEALWCIGCSVKFQTTNNEPVWMRCWKDSSWFNGNYNSNRWFLVTRNGGATGWMHSSYVYHQAAVPNCDA